MAQPYDFSNTHIVQYAIGVNGTIDPKWSRPLKNMENKIISGMHFWGVQATPYGIRKIKKATHVGIFDLSLTDDKALLFSFEMPTENIRRKVIPIKNHFLILKTSPTYMKITISEHKSYTSALENSAITKTLEENH